MPAGFKQSEHFIAAINKHKGPAKANKYLLTGPYGVVVEGIAKYLGHDMRDFKFMCDAANLPGRNLATTEFRTGSVSKSYVHSNNFNPTMTLSFILTDDMFIKKIFDRWMDDIISLTDGKLSNAAAVQNILKYPDQYCGSFGIKKLATNLSSSPASASHIDTYHVEIMEAFPKQINPIQLTYGSQDIMKLQVVMAYSRWRIIRGY